MICKTLNKTLLGNARNGANQNSPRPPASSYSTSSLALRLLGEFSLVWNWNLFPVFFLRTAHYADRVLEWKHVSPDTSHFLPTLSPEPRVFVTVRQQGSLFSPSGLNRDMGFSSFWGRLLVQALLLILADSHKPPINSHVNLSVSLEQKVELFCNVSLNNTTQLTWRKDGRVIFSFTKQTKETFKNFTSDRMRIDLEDPTTLWISAVQMSDVGIYLCSSNTLWGSRKMKWTLNIKGAGSVSHSEGNIKEIWYSVPPITAGMCVTVGICCVLLLCRRCSHERILDINMGVMTAAEYQSVSKVRSSDSSHSFRTVNYIVVESTG
ncbi:hypothetical protein GN956_G25670 [Arapaima gigas]